jgi:hypothetical protein
LLPPLNLSASEANEGLHAIEEVIIDLNEQEQEQKRAKEQEQDLNETLA